MKFTCKAALVLATLTFSNFSYAGYVDPGKTVTEHKFATQKVVYQLNSGEASIQKSVLKNMLNQHAALEGNITEVLVVHGNGMSLLTGTDPDLNKLIDNVRKTGAKIQVCNNTLKERDIDFNSLYGVTQEHIVRSGVAQIVALQHKGYGYLKP